MTKRIGPTIFLVALLCALPLLAGCGGGEENAEPAEAAAEAVEAVATHDCAGGCGMKAVAEDQMKEVDGEFYCAGCAAKLETEETSEDHSGHGHG